MMRAYLHFHTTGDSSFSCSHTIKMMSEFMLNYNVNYTNRTFYRQFSRVCDVIKIIEHHLRYKLKHADVTC